MKRFVLVVVLVGLLATALAGVAFAAPPAPGALGAGNGIHTPGTGLAQPGTGYGPGMGAGTELGAAAGVRRGAPEWAGGPDDVAGILGLTVEELQAQRLAGQSLAQIAQAKGLDEQALVEKRLAARRADLEHLVSDGKLGQAQADLMLQNMGTQVSAMVNRTTTGPARQGQDGAPLGGRMGRGGGCWTSR